MTIEEIEGNLPNGFHDASLKRIEIDYVKMVAVLDIDVDTSSPDTDEEYREGRLTLTGLLFCVIDPPDFRSPVKTTEGVWIADSGQATTEQLTTKLPGPIPAGVFVHYFYINDWNAFLYVAAASARLDWG
jgi:hypothetical protein